MTKVVNIHRGEHYDVYIGRPSPFGNPFTHLKRVAIGHNMPTMFVPTREDAIKEFKNYFLEKITNNPKFRAQVLALKGKTLGCFCKPLSCHGDVIADWLDKQPSPD